MRSLLAAVLLFLVFLVPVVSSFRASGLSFLSLVFPLSRSKQTQNWQIQSESPLFFPVVYCFGVFLFLSMLLRLLFTTQREVEGGEGKQGDQRTEVQGLSQNKHCIVQSVPQGILHPLLPLPQKKKKKLQTVWNITQLKITFSFFLSFFFPLFLFFLAFLKSLNIECCVRLSKYTSNSNSSWTLLQEVRCLEYSLVLLQKEFFLTFSTSPLFFLLRFLPTLNPYKSIGTDI